MTCKYTYIYAMHMIKPCAGLSHTRGRVLSQKQNSDQPIQH